MSGLFQGKVEYFNGKEWVEIKNYKKGDKVLTFNRLTNKISLMTPIQHIKKRANTLEVYKFMGNVVSFYCTSDLVLYCKRKDCSNKGDNELIHENIMSDIMLYPNILKDNDEVICTFNYDSKKSCMMNYNHIKIMFLSMILGKISSNGIDCTMILDKKMAIKFGKLLKGINVERKRLDDKVEFKYRLPRSIDLFMSPLDFNNEEIGQMITVILDFLNKNKTGYSLKIENERIRDFIQIICSMYGYQCILRKDRLNINTSRNSYRIGLKELNKVKVNANLYNFRITNDYIVCRCDGVILLLSSY